MDVGREEPVVLVADNDPGVSALLQEVLSRSGLRTVVVADGEAALQFLAQRGVAVLVCDLDMPKLGGEEVLQRLGEFADPPPVLVISGYLDAEIERQLRGHAAVRGVFRKPFDVFSFAEAVQRLVRSADEAGEADR